MFIQDLGFYDADEEYIEIVGEPIYGKIEGGSQRLVSWEEETVFDGSSSFDPNIINGTLEDIHFRWYCKVRPGALLFKIGDGGCFGYGENVVENNLPVWRIPPKEFIRNAAYIITLVVESKHTKGRESVSQQIVDVRSGSVMKTTSR